MANAWTSYILHLADNALILGHRNSEWCGHGPVLEQDIALTNISLDLIGQARYLYQYAAELMGGTETEDSLAFLRDGTSFRNLLMLELPKGDWGHTLMRQYLFAQFQHLHFGVLKDHPDERLAAIAAKVMKETAYHLRWSRDWVLRLGDGTTESHIRMQNALERLWPYTGEWFTPASFETTLAQTHSMPDLACIEADWRMAVSDTLKEATLALPAAIPYHRGGKEGLHSEHLSRLLTEMQFLQRAYPGCEW